MLGSAREVATNLLAMFSYGLLHIDALVLGDQLKLTFISSVRTLDEV